MKKLLELIVEHPLWVFVLGVATILGLCVTLWPTIKPNPGPRSIPSIIACDFPTPNDKRLQEYRRQVYEEVYGYLESAPKEGTDDVIHASFISHHNTTRQLPWLADTKQCHLDEIELMDEQLSKRLGKSPTTEFTGDVRHAIRIGIHNMRLKYED